VVNFTDNTLDKTSVNPICPGLFRLNENPGGGLYSPPLVFHLNEGLETPNLEHELIYTIWVPMQNFKSELLKIADLWWFKSLIEISKIEILRCLGCLKIANIDIANIDIIDWTYRLSYHQNELEESKRII